MNVTTAAYQNMNMVDDDYFTDEIKEISKPDVKQNTTSTKTQINTHGNDTFDSVPEIEQYNNYSINGTLNITGSELNLVEGKSLEKDDNALLPWWFQKMIRDCDLDSEWILQMLEEAGLEKTDIIDWRQMKQNEREMFRQMLKDQAESARLFAEGLAEEMKMRRKMMEAFKEIVQGKKTSPEGQQLLAQFAPMLLFIALLLKKEDEESEEDYIPNKSEETNHMSDVDQVSGVTSNNYSAATMEAGAFVS